MDSIRTQQWVTAALPTVAFVVPCAAGKQVVTAAHQVFTPFGTRTRYTVKAPTSASPPG